MPSETIVTQLRVLGSRAYAAAMNQAATSTKAFDASQSRLGRTADTIGGKIDRLGQKVVTYGQRSAIALGAVGAAGVWTGLKFDAAMERSEIGMDTLLHNAKLAKKTAENVRDFALKAPLFGVEQMMTSAQQLIGAGFEAKDVVKTLTLFSDTLSAMGRKPEDLQRITYAFVQMMSKGQISAEELRGQLGEIFPAQKILAREMGKTPRQLTKEMKKGAIRGRKPLQLLMQGMQKDFGGGTEKMAKTFDGQLANIKESTKYTMGNLFMPLFTNLEKHVMPAVATFGSEFNDVLTNNRLSAQQKWQQVQGLFNVYLKPLWQQWMRQLDQADVPGKVAKVMDKVLPVVFDKGTEMAAGMAKRFINAWWHADLGSKLFVGFLVAAKFGVFQKIAGLAADAFIQKYVTSATGKKNAGKMKAAGGSLGRIFGKAMALGIAFAIVQFGPDIEKAVHKALGLPGGGKEKGQGLFDWLWHGSKDSPGLDTIWKGSKHVPGIGDVGKWIWRHRTGGGDPFRRAAGGPVTAGVPYIVGERQPEVFVPNMNGTILPKLPDLSGAFVIHNYTVLDRKVVAKSVSRQTADNMARR